MFLWLFFENIHLLNSEFTSMQEAPRVDLLPPAALLLLVEMGQSQKSSMAASHVTLQQTPQSINTIRSFSRNQDDADPNPPGQVILVLPLLSIRGQQRFTIQRSHLLYPSVDSLFELPKSWIKSITLHSFLFSPQPRCTINVKMECLATK